MSVWYQIHITAFSKNKTAVANFFNLNDDWTETRVDNFKFSFGCKNAPGLSIFHLLKKNPDLIFLINQEIEDTSQWMLMRYDTASDKLDVIFIQDSISDDDGNLHSKINKKILEEYTIKYPKLVEQHSEHKEKFEWNNLFYNFDKCTEYLNQANQYVEMVKLFNYRYHYND